MLYEDLADDFLQLRGILSLDKIHSAVVNPDKGVDFVLAFVAVNENSIPGDLSKAMGVSTARTAVLLNSMEEKGLIVRERDSADGRQTVLRLLPEGEKMYQEKRKELRKIVVKMLESLGPEDAKDYIRLHKRLVDSLQNIL